MPATVQIDSFHGASHTPSALTDTAYYNLTDSDAFGSVGTGMPIPMVNPSENYSWRKYFKLNFTTTPGTQIANLRFYVGTPPTGIHHYANITNIYTQPSANDQSGVSGLTDNQTSKDAANELNHSTTNPLYVNNGVVLTNPSTGYGSQEYVITQVGITNLYDPTEAPSLNGSTSTTAGAYRYQES